MHALRQVSLQIDWQDVVKLWAVPGAPRVAQLGR